ARTTATAAVHLLTGIPSIHDRNLQLNASYIFRLHHQHNNNNYAIQLYRHFRNKDFRPKSLISMSLNTNYHIGWLRENNEFDQLKPLAPAPIPVMTGAKSQTPEINVETRNIWHQMDAVNMRDIGIGTLVASTPVARLLPVISITHSDNRRRRPPIIEYGSRWMARHTFRPIILWMLGRVAHHQKCHKCHTNLGITIGLSRQHAVSCSGMDTWLAANYPGGIPQPPDHWNPNFATFTVIDQILYDIDFQNSPTTRRKVRTIAEAIERIRVDCGNERKVHDILHRTAYVHETDEMRELIAEAQIGQTRTMPITVTTHLQTLMHDYWNLDHDGGIIVEVDSGLDGTIELPAEFGRELERNPNEGRGRGGANGRGGTGRGRGGNARGRGGGIQPASVPAQAPARGGTAARRMVAGGRAPRRGRADRA
ncbi:hypothetical protein HDU76_010994, partial [Blyttiomyces sp. JEL0837]